jgi:hypothetical protein
MIRTLKYAFWNIFDNLFITAIINFFWFLIHFVVIIIVAIDNETTIRIAEFFNTIFFYLNNEAGKQFVNLNINGHAIPLLKIIHKIILFAVFVQFSPFTIAVNCLNQSFSNREHAGFIDYLNYLKKYFLKGSFLLIINLLIVIIAFYNIAFYQDRFFNIKILYYIFTIGTLFVLTLYLVATIHFIPLLINENKSLIQTFKRAYYLTIANLLPTFGVSLIFLILIFISLNPYLMPLLMFVYPVAFGQFVYEHYISTTEKYGNKRNFEENRSFSHFLFPWKLQK